LVEFYDNLFGNADWVKVDIRPRKYWYIPFGFLDYLISTFWFNNRTYSFWEHLVGIAGAPSRIWGLYFYRYMLQEQFYIANNLNDCINPLLHKELSIYIYPAKAYNNLNTHYDLVFPYFMHPG
jgi:hypothetical protein